MAKKKKIDKIERHKAQCQICNSPQKEDIEMDYLHCIPIDEICRRYNIHYETLRRHVNIFGLNKKRDRKAFYWLLIERAKAPLKGGIRPEVALEAAKWLDKLEGKVNQEVPPTQIIVNYPNPEKLGIKKKKEDGEHSQS